MGSDDTEDDDGVGPVNLRHTCKVDLDGTGAQFHFQNGSYPRNKEHLFDECVEHAGNTCCMMKHIDFIRHKLSVIRAE